MVGFDLEQQPGGDGLAPALDEQEFGFAQLDDALDESRRRLRDHHPARRRDRFHPLGDAHLLADRRVGRRARAEFASDDLPGVQSDADDHLDALALELGGQALHLPLKGEGGEAAADRVIFEGDLDNDAKFEGFFDKFRTDSDTPLNKNTLEFSKRVYRAA